MRTYLLLVVVTVLWGSAFAASKVAVDAIDHHVAAAVRFTIGALVLLAVLPVLRRRTVPLGVRDIGVTGALGLVGVFGYNMFFFWALTIAPSADGAVIVPVLTPVITVAVSAALRQQRLTRVRLTGLVTAVAGAVVFFAGIPSTGGSDLPHRFVGDLIFVAAAGCWSGYTILGAPVLRRLPALPVTAYATAAGAMALIAVATPSIGTVAWGELSAGFWLNQAYLAVLPTALAYVLYYHAVNKIGAASAVSTMFLVPVSGLACSMILLGESITWPQAAGSVLMLAGAFFATRAAGSPTVHRHDRSVPVPRPVALR
jgi:drug/metabolite transporter (DMT)-like permease